MSWEYSTYKARCNNCGKEGRCIRGSDDWNRTTTSWDGFESQPPDATAVARKRFGSRDYSPICNCGSSAILVGDEIISN